jgi:hypothetical protein
VKVKQDFVSISRMEYTAVKTKAKRRLLKEMWWKGVSLIHLSRSRDRCEQSNEISGSIKCAEFYCCLQDVE